MPVREFDAIMRSGALPSLQSRYSLPELNDLILPGHQHSRLEDRCSLRVVVVTCEAENSNGAIARVRANTALKLALYAPLEGCEERTLERSDCRLWFQEWVHR